MIDTPSTSFAAAVTPLNRKAMLVKLTCSKPTTSRRDKEVEAVVQAQYADTGLTVLQQLFKDKANPVRIVINEASQVYTYHVAHTLPWSDRGPRMLPVEQYVAYSTAMRGLIGDVESSVAALMPRYDALVQQDIYSRGARAQLSDYPTAEEFKEKMQFKFFFSPLPDVSHFLFDINPEDKAALTAQLEEVEKQAKNEVAGRIHAPLVHLVNKLKVGIGEPGAIFRDSAVENVNEACDIARQLAMGDETVLAMIDEVKQAIRPLVKGMHVVRESPVERANAANKLDEVAKKMSFMFGRAA